MSQDSCNGGASGLKPIFSAVGRLLERAVRGSAVVASPVESDAPSKTELPVALDDALPSTMCCPSCFSAKLSPVGLPDVPKAPDERRDVCCDCAEGLTCSTTSRPSVAALAHDHAVL